MLSQSVGKAEIAHYNARQIRDRVAGCVIHQNILLDSEVINGY